MDMIDKLRELAARVERVRSRYVTEEGTKNALVMPFIQALGYDVFDPLQVVPEFTADVGIKKGEKVDYALLRDDKPIILFECKALGAKLDESKSSQLHRYFHTTSARFAILTDGVHYKLFTDLESPNLMDARPFLEFDLTRIDDRTANEIKKFSRELFDVDQILSSASTLKYVKGIRRLLEQEWSEPSEGFIRHFAAQVYDGRLSPSVKEEFAPLMKQAFQVFVSEMINARLQSAMTGSAPASPIESSHEGPTNDGAGESETGIVTTDEELEAFHLLKAIVQPVIDPDRVTMRDGLSYCAIMIDDNNRKPLCRLFLQGRKWSIGLFGENKEVDRVSITTLKDLFHYADRLRSTAARYVGTIDSGATLPDETGSAVGEN